MKAKSLRLAWGLIEWLARWPWWVAAGLSMVLAAAVGYLLELAILHGWRAPLQVPPFWLLLAGGLAAGFSSAAWGAGQATAMRRGVFLHLVADDRRERHLAEDALLRARVSALWPRAAVFPLRIESKGPDAREAAVRLAQAMAEQSRVAWVAAPAARGLAILAGGPSEVLGPAGALAATSHAGGGHTLWLLTDDTSPRESAFLEFPLTPADGVAAGPGTRESALLLLNSARDQSLVMSRLEESLRARDGAAVIAQVALPESIPERSSAYTQIVDQVRSQLSDLPGGRVFIQGDAPACLMFAAGYLAGERGLTVHSGEFKNSEYLVASQAPRPDPEPMAGLAGPLAGLRRAWWRALAGQSLLLGMGLPTLAGASAMALEWGLAGSQAGKLTFANWSAAFVVLAFSLALVWFGSTKLASQLLRPEIEISHSRAASTLGHRMLTIPEPVLAGPADTLASWVAARIAELLTVLPGARTVKVDMGPASACPEGQNAITNHYFGLTKSLRSSGRVELQWDGQHWSSGPQSDPGPSSPGQ